MWLLDMAGKGYWAITDIGITPDLRPEEAKHIRYLNFGKKGLEGQIFRLSRNCAEMTLDGPVEMMTNLKMNLEDVDEKLSARDFYGKVIKRAGNKEENHGVHFTSLPPEVDAYFQSHRQHAIRPAAG